MNTFSRSMEQFLTLAFQEDDLSRNSFYLTQLPQEIIRCELKIKSDLVLAGLPFFVEVFKYLGWEGDSEILQFEGQKFSLDEKKSLYCEMPFAIALTGERIALNLLQRASSIATTASLFAEKAQGKGISILDTRKTTPGLRFLEKYATRIGGAHNHRFGQGDVWMIKDNHKSYFGGLENAWKYFQSMKTFYNPVVVEIHDLVELEKAFSLGVKHIMLDNFTPENIQRAIEIKPEGISYEVSGGITLNSIDDYLIKGVDAISVGALTHSPEKVDLSFKYPRNTNG